MNTFSFCALQLPVNSGKKLHPLLVKVADLVKERRNSLDNLDTLETGEDLKEIYGRLNNEEIVIINEFHKSRCFRKLHLELALIGNSLQILHCVFFPDFCYELPIFGVDLVVTPDGVSAAILDLSPVGNKLPVNIESRLVNIQGYNFMNSRELPDWGFIFSPYVCFVKPVNISEENAFVELVDKYLTLLISISSSTFPDLPESQNSIERYNRQNLYCVQQRRNDKTRNILAQFFDISWANKYIDIVLFDTPPYS